MKKHIEVERRRYIRLNTAFPVEFQLVDEDKRPISAIFQGFTKNVGKGGMCIEAKVEKGKDIFSFLPNKTRMKLIIDIPSSSVATESYATVKWTERIREYFLDTYKFGVEYNEIESDNQKMIEQYAAWLYKRPKIIFIYFVVMLVIAVLLTYLAARAR